MPGIMQPYGGKASPLESLGKVAIHRAWVDGALVFLGKDQLTITIPAAQSELLFCLAGTVLAQGGNTLGRQCHCTPGVLRLGFQEYQHRLLARALGVWHPLQDLADMEHPGLQIYILPSEPKQFATPKASQKEREERAIQSVSLQGRYQPRPYLGNCQRCAYLVRGPGRLHQSHHIPVDASYLLCLLQGVREHRQMLTDRAGIKSLCGFRVAIMLNLFRLEGLQRDPAKGRL